ALQLRPSWRQKLFACLEYVADRLHQVVRFESRPIYVSESTIGLRFDPRARSPSKRTLTKRSCKKRINDPALPLIGPVEFDDDRVQRVRVSQQWFAIFAVCDRLELNLGLDWSQQRLRLFYVVTDMCNQPCVLAEALLTEVCHFRFERPERILLLT